MPRKRVRKTRQSQSELSNYAAAHEDVKQGTSLHGVNRMSLLRYLRKRDKANEDEGTGSTITMGYAAHNKETGRPRRRTAGAAARRSGFSLYFSGSQRKPRNARRRRSERLPCVPFITSPTSLVTPLDTMAERSKMTETDQAEITKTKAKQSSTATVWTSRLPSSVQTIIASQSKSTLEEVSELADQIMDVATPSQQITAVSANPGATSESNQIAALTRQVQALAAKLDRMSRPRKGGQPTSVIIYHQPGPCQTTGSFLTAGTTQNSERRRVDA
ncbi:hypothetical protein EVAR_24348_1 [Eumeta japonica]|uniref:Uncharacterized protein n=1 Tax=Eumeta variegata TaxID=151549 RepID=A0A4C1VK42_EUMVA|nr:hypothetical protein EVAR_24348_1 [Eumeta japonica]